MKSELVKYQVTIVVNAVDSKRYLPLKCSKKKKVPQMCNFI